MTRTLAWGRKVPPDFAEKVNAICGRIGIADPSWLMACIAFETGRTFKSSTQNRISKATGLIQFMPSTARGLGTSVEELAAMTEIEQLDYVEKYFEPFRGQLRSLSDTYMAILWPKGVGKQEDEVLFDSTTQAYLQNRGLDINKDGGITKAEATAFVVAQLEEGLKPENAIPMAAPIEDRSVPYQPREESTMDPFSIIAMFGPMIANLIPQLAKLFVDPEDKKQTRNIEAIQLVIDTFTKAGLGNPAASGTNVAQVAQAVEAVRADPVLRQEVTKAVLTEPAIMAVLEVGGGITKAREHDLAVMSAPQPFWKTSAVFYVSLILLPLVYWFVGSIIVGGAIERVASLKLEMPAWMQLILALFGDAWDAETRAGAFNLVAGLVLGGICGVYFGVSVTKNASQNSNPEK